jgi:hypothetical protein
MNTHKQEFINRINGKTSYRLNEAIEDYQIQLDLLEKFLEEGTAKTFFKSTGGLNFKKVEKWFEENKSKLNGSSDGNQNNLTSGDKPQSKDPQNNNFRNFAG